MSLRVRKTLGIRSNTIKKEPNKKFIFAFEGEKTEKQYFEGIEKNRIELGIKDIITIESLERKDSTRSNQLAVVKDVDSYLKNIVICQSCNENIKAQLESILDSYKNDLGDIYEEIELLLSNIFKNNNYRENLKLFIQKLFQLIDDCSSLDELIDNIKSFSDDLEYEKDFDIVCIIIDRDRHSFTEIQYDQVINICRDNNYKLGITNPCFEFWLLLHHTDCKEYSKEEILNNYRKTKYTKNFLEKCLTKKLGSYKKNKLRFDVFKNNIKTAIKNEKLYCNDIIDLKNEVGSSIGSIISQIL